MLSDIAIEVYRVGFVVAAVATGALAVALMAVLIRTRGEKVPPTADDLIRPAEAGWAGAACLAALVAAAGIAGDDVAVNVLVLTPVVFGFAAAGLLALGRRVAGNTEPVPRWAPTADAFVAWASSDAAETVGPAGVEGTARAV